MNSKYYYSMSLLILITSCNQIKKRQIVEELVIDSIENKIPFLTVSDTNFIELINYSDKFSFEMKYATDDNFLKKAVYDCDKCLIRKEVADALIKANDTLMSLGFHIKFFDCYRPLDVQKLMWDIYPDARYVANPHKTGSIHNRGGAVDITLEDDQGNELNMGTPFDYFGIEAHHSYTELPNEVLINRKLLRTIMKTYGFNSISTEWWHYNFKNAKKYGLSNFKVDCE